LASEGITPSVAANVSSANGSILMDSSFQLDAYTRLLMQSACRIVIHTEETLERITQPLFSAAVKTNEPTGSPK
jgi:hypothetical protein